MNACWTKLCRFLADFGRDRQGVAAVEFALVLPFLMLLLAGMAEFTTALNQKQKVSQAARSVADLIAQAEIVSASDMAEVFDAAEEIMEPYTNQPLDVIVSSVTFDEDGEPTVDWSSSLQGSTAWIPGSPPEVDIPEEIRFPNTSLVIGYAESTYTAHFAALWPDSVNFMTNIELSDIYFLRPRLTGTVLFQ